MLVMKTLVVLADQGHFKAFNLDEIPGTRTPRLEMVEEFDNVEAHGRLVDKVSDLSGRFSRGQASPTGGMSDGERHNIDLEKRKRLTRQLAQRVNKLADRDDVE